MSFLDETGYRHLYQKIVNKVQALWQKVGTATLNTNAQNTSEAINELKGTLDELTNKFILRNVVRVEYQVVSNDNRLIIWLYSSYTDSSHYEAFRVDFNGSSHRIFFQKLVNGVETTIGYVTLS